MTLEMTYLGRDEWTVWLGTTEDLEQEDEDFTVRQIQFRDLY